MIITLNSALAPMAHKVIRFRSGKVTSEEVNATPLLIADIEWKVIGDAHCKTLCETPRETSDAIRETTCETFCETAEPRR